MTLGGESFGSCVVMGVMIPLFHFINVLLQSFDGYSEQAELILPLGGCNGKLTAFYRQNTRLLH